MALDYLRARHLRLITRNFRCRLGEIDLVMLDDECLVFVEVRYRKAGQFASAVESVDARKQRKLALAAAVFLSRKRHYTNYPVRFDVVAIDAVDNATPRLEWITDAFRPET